MESSSPRLTQICGWGALAIRRPFVHSIASPQLGGPEKNPTASSQDALKPRA